MISSSGIGTQVLNVLRRLVRDKSISLRLLGDPIQIYNALPEFQGKVTGFTAPIYSLAEQFSFPELEEGEILHVPHYNAPLKHLHRSVVIIHDLIHLQSREFSAPHYRLYSHLLLWIVTWRARRIATVSETTRMELLQRFPRAAAKTSVILNGINHKILFPPEEKALKKFRKRHSLPGKFFLCVGIGKRHKNIDFVIRALGPRWRNGQLKTPLVLAGTGGTLPNYINEVLEFYGVRDRLILMPRVEEEELRLLYGSATCFILPSLYEGFGFPLVEAMACGTPTLASHASCLPEIGADACEYFNPRDPTSLLSAIDKLDDARRRDAMIKLGKRRAKHFTWKKHAKALAGLYSEIQV